MPGRTLLVVLVVLAVILVACDAGAAGGTAPGGPPASPLAPTTSATPAATGPGRQGPTPTREPTMTQPPSAVPAPTGGATPGPASSNRPRVPRPTARHTATPVAARCTASRKLNVFAAGLLDAMARRDAKALEERLARSFTFVVEATDVDIPAMSSREAVRTLLTGLRVDGFLGPGGRPAIVPLARAARVRCAPGVPLDRATGAAILGRPYDAAFLATGWGTGGDEEAFVFLATTGSGRVVWRGTWYSSTGFER